MVGIAVRKVLLATAAATALLSVAGACGTANPQAASSPLGSAAASATPAASPAVTPAAAVSATPAPTAARSGGALGELTGAWQGTWTNESPQTAVGTFTLTWAQQGNLLVGAIGVNGSNCISAGNVTGNIDGDKISFGAVESGTVITFIGTVKGNTMSGTYTSDCGNSKGTWTAIRG